MIPTEERPGLIKLAKDMLAGKVFTSAHLMHPYLDRDLSPEVMAKRFVRDLQGVFMVIALGGIEVAEKAQEILRSGGILYEYIDKAGPLAMNGMPMFFSMHFIDGERFDFVRHVVKRLEQAEGGIEDDLLKDTGDPGEEGDEAEAS